MGWQFYGLCAVVALLGLNVLLQSTQIQILLRVQRLLERRADEELKHPLTKTELIVEAPNKETKKKGFLPTDPPRM
jgi:hypothetical protein